MSTRHDDLPDAAEAGRICATAGQVQRDLHNRATAHPSLYPPELFDGGVFSAIALANTFASPWLSPLELRPVNRAALWTFGLDRLVDMVATGEEQVAALASACLTAVDTGVAVDPLTTFLLELHTDLVARPGYASLGAVWFEELRRLLDAMVRERRWLAAGTRPSIERYLDNADNLALAFVTATHAVAIGESTDGMDELRHAVRVAQRALRLVNDVATVDRDVRHNDLNALLLGLDLDEAMIRIAADAQRARAAFTALRHRQPALAAHSVRQLDYNVSFYAAADYWTA